MFYKKYYVVQHKYTFNILSISFQYINQLLIIVPSKKLLRQYLYFCRFCNSESNQNL